MSWSILHNPATNIYVYLCNYEKLGILGIVFHSDAVVGNDKGPVVVEVDWDSEPLETP